MPHDKYGQPLRRGCCEMHPDRQGTCSCQGGAAGTSKETIDFGAPADFGARVFRVEIPTSRTGEVVIVEDYGYCGAENGVPPAERRVILERRVWSGIADVAQQEFNARLKAAKLKTGKWHVGTNRVERLLGRELCVLAWAAEKATDDELPIISSKWAALRPEERWWLFVMTVAEAGLPEDHRRGWRQALHLALADGEPLKQGKRRRRPVEPDLFYRSCSRSARTRTETIGFFTRGAR